MVAPLRIKLPETCSEVQQVFVSKVMELIALFGVLRAWILME
jgi:hypothetical protein